MIDFSKVHNYYIACGYTDMRKQIDGLVTIIQLQFGRMIDEESLFLFCGHKSDRVKAIYWDGTGYILLYKRLREKRFQWPRNEQELKQLNSQEFRWLMEDCQFVRKKLFNDTKNASSSFKRTRLTCYGSVKNVGLCNIETSFQTGTLL